MARAATATLATVLAVAFVPHPPALVPDLCGGRVGELDGVRSSSSAAVDGLLAAGPERVWLVGSGPSQRWYGAGDGGSLAPFGRPVEARLGGPAGSGPPRLPLSLTVGAWLLDGAGYAGERLALSVPADADERLLRDLAAELVGPAAMLVLADGSATRGTDAPGPQHPSAGRFDDAVHAAIAAGDATALSTVDARLGADVRAQGVPAWRLAGFRLQGVPVDAEVLYYGAPFGVSYLVAGWVPRG